MARLFYISVAGGVVLALLFAGLFPLPQLTRYRSSISVIPDGGREETFVIDWHLDRVQTLRPEGGGPLQLAGALAFATGPDGPAAAAEVFRLRDQAGNVIGLASRTLSERAGAGLGQGAVSQWMLLLPSRGMLFLSQLNARDIAPRPGGPAGEWRPAADAAEFWQAGQVVRITAGPAPGGAGRVLGGTEEFAGLDGDYDETWELGKLDAKGASRGRIRLTTRLRAGS